MNARAAGQQFTYAFDDIGNRQSASRGGDHTRSNLRRANYTAAARFAPGCRSYTVMAAALKGPHHTGRPALGIQANGT